MTIQQLDQIGHYLSFYQQEKNKEREKERITRLCTRRDEIPSRVARGIVFIRLTNCRGSSESRRRNKSSFLPSGARFPIRFISSAGTERARDSPQTGLGKVVRLINSSSELTPVMLLFRELVSLGTPTRGMSSSSLARLWRRQRRREVESVSVRE